MQDGMEHVVRPNDFSTRELTHSLDHFVTIRFPLSENGEYDWL